MCSWRVNVRKLYARVCVCVTQKRRNKIKKVSLMASDSFFNVINVPLTLSTHDIGKNRINLFNFGVIYFWPRSFFGNKLLFYDLIDLFVFLCRMVGALHLTLVILLVASAYGWRPCPELSTALRFPCRCKVEPFGPKLQLGAVAMDCDHVVFQTEGPTIPTGAPIISYSQRYSGQQVLPTQVMSYLKKQKL